MSLLRMTPRNGRSLLVAVSSTVLLACGDGAEPTGPVLGQYTIVELHAVTGGSGFVAVGTEILAQDDAVVMGEQRAIAGVSLTGVAWQWIDIGEPGVLLDVAFGDGINVAVGYRLAASGQVSSLMLRSTDGVAWERIDADDIRSWDSVTYGEGWFVATGGAAPTGPMLVSISPDGRTWEHVAATNLWEAKVRFALGAFRVTGAAGVVFSSTDLDEWTVQELPELNYVAGLAEVDGRLVAHGHYDCCFGEEPEFIRYYTLISDADGVFTVHERQLRRLLTRHVAASDGVLGLSIGALLRSTDLLSWKTVHQPPDPLAYMNDIVHANGRFVVVGRRQILASVDGYQWTGMPMPDHVATR